MVSTLILIQTSTHVLRVEYLSEIQGFWMSVIDKKDYKSKI